MQTRRLLVDFDLSQEPSDRLHHLDRMHSWFVTHGQKQVRKTKAGPNYIKVEKNAEMPAGSTQHVSSKLSTTSFILAGAMAMRRSRNVPSLPPGATDLYST